jgi:glyoxylase-like metal-dependent hydrolase (beta-lactamase superfamily II)
MLTRVAVGVLVHESEFMQSNTVVVQGRAGVLLIDPGITGEEMVALARDIRELGQPVAAGFSTHPHWDHVLWHSDFGAAPRYGTARCAASMRHLRANPDWQSRVATFLPSELAEAIPTGLLGLVTGLPVGAAVIPWDGPTVRIIEHRAHTAGHAALLVEECGALVAGDMLSDILMPILDMDAADPIEDYLEALRLFDGVTGEAEVVIPGHGSIGGADQVRPRIEQDREYVKALGDGRAAEDARLLPSGPLDWLPDVHRRQVQRLAEKADPASE